jgi:hypothetical protein
MTLADFFLAINGAGVRLANVGGDLQLRGPANAITTEMRTAASEHKTAILALLPAAPPPATEDNPAQIDARDTDSIAQNASEPCLPAQKAESEESGGIMGVTEGFRHDHDWRDWRLEWLLEVGKMYLRMRQCKEQSVLVRLRSLTEVTPGSLPEWLALARQIVNSEDELRQEGKLPSYPWPAG